MIFSIAPKTIIAHIFVFIAYLIMYYFTFFNVKRKLILILNSISQIMFGIHYILLGALSGTIVSFIGMIMFIIFSFKDKNKFFKSIFIPLFFVLIYSGVGLYSYFKTHIIIEILPIICNYIAIYSFFRNKEIEIKTYNIPISILWITYNIFFSAWVGLVCQIILLIFDIIFIFKYFFIVSSLSYK